MSANTRNSGLSLGDRYAEISVLVVVALALLLGWGLMTNVEMRTVPFTSDTGISARVPQGWLTSQGDKKEILHASQMGSGFGTTYSIATFPTGQDVTPAEVSSYFTLERGGALTAYRVLDQAEVGVNGQNAYRIEFAYVESDPNLTHASLPVVVHGIDYIFVSGDKAVVVTYRASEANFDGDFSRFSRFLASVQF